MGLPVTEFIWLVLLTMTIYIFYNKRKTQNSAYPPGPQGLPFIGNMLQLGNVPHKKMMEWSKEYGKIYSIYLGTEHCIVLNDPKVIKDLFNDISSTGRPGNPVSLAVSEGRYGLVNAEGKPWEAQRRFVLRTLRDFGFSKTSMEGMIVEEISSFLDWMESKKEAPITCYRLFNTAVVNALWYIVTGEKNEWHGSGMDSKSELLRVADDFMPAIQGCVKTGLFQMPFLRQIIPKLSGWNQLQYAVQGINGLCEKVVHRHKATLDPASPKDFVDEYLIEISKTSDPDSSFYGKHREQNLKITVADLFEGGNETTSTQLCWIMLYLSQHNGIQKKLQAEIDKAVGSDRFPALSDKNMLPYVEAVIQEVFRVSPLIPLGVPHKMTVDKHFHGYLLPKGATVFANLYTCAKDPEIWGDPENFRPERFFSEDGSTVLKHEAVIPFSIGRRVCIGETLARDTLFLFITSIFQRFDILPDPNNSHPEFEPEVGILMVPKPFTFIARKRNI